jgi:hypothetical protein
MLATLNGLNSCLQKICKPLNSYNGDRIDRLTELLEKHVAGQATSQRIADTPSELVSNPDPFWAPRVRDNETSRAMQWLRDNGSLPEMPEVPKTLTTSFLDQNSQSSGISEVKKERVAHLNLEIRLSAESSPTEEVFLVSLEMLTECIEKKAISRLLRAGRERPKTWGCTAFVWPSHLDQIFDQSRPGGNAINRCIIGILVDLFMVLVSFIYNIGETGRLI